MSCLIWRVHGVVSLLTYIICLCEVISWAFNSPISLRARSFVVQMAGRPCTSQKVLLALYFPEGKNYFMLGSLAI